MKDYFLMPDLVYDDYRETLKDYVLNYKDWSFYGKGRFKIYVGSPERDVIIPIAIKFKNPRNLFYKIELNKVKAWGIVAPHTDHDRYATINLPITGDFENSSVDFYTPNAEGVSSTMTTKDNEVQSTGAKLYTDSELNDVVKYTTPICFNTQTVHGVTNYSAEDRYILTLSLKEEFTFQKLQDMYDNGELLA